MSIFDSFKKKHDFLVCVDSDGCAMDTMNCKHFHCFGPCMVAQWGLDAWRNEILERWNVINLFSMTRGINRFKGLAMALGEIHEKYTPITGIAALQHWADTAPALSNDAVAKAADNASDPDQTRNHALERPEELDYMRGELIKMLEREKKAYFIKEGRFAPPFTVIIPDDPNWGLAHQDFSPEYFDFSVLEGYK